MQILLFFVLFGIALYIFAVAVIVAIYIGVFGFALAGWYMVKTTHPLVPKGVSGAETVAYSVMWAYAITIALLLGSLFSRNMLEGTSSDAHIWIPHVLSQAAAFWVESASVILLSAIVARSALAKQNHTLARGIMAGFGAISFSMTNELAHGKANGLQDFVIHVIQNKIRLVSLILQTMIQGIVHASQEIWRWIISIRGSLFELTDGLAVVLAIYSLTQFAKSATYRRNIESKSDSIRYEPNFLAVFSIFIASLCLFVFMIYAGACEAGIVNSASCVKIVRFFEVNPFWMVATIIGFLGFTFLLGAVLLGTRRT